ncbi:MAG: TerB family tellurite resistance protein [Caulobacteraceae bacterium]|nr:TerB family tellurite resistance protein [Caulobacteraceae bacterium]MBP6690203.1 TerB family tellurite resistance protein [Hyphomonadaceae bacterium]
MIFFLTQAAADAAQPDSSSGGGGIIALFVIVAALGLWFALRTFVRGLQANKTQSATGGDFAGYALEALVNAAKLDGRVNQEEKRAIVIAMREIAGEAFEAAKVEEGFARPGLNKAELVSFLSARARAFTRDQKVALLKALMAVFVSDGKFDEAEHVALLDYTAAIGFDREGAPQLLRSFTRGSIT